MRLDLDPQRLVCTPGDQETVTISLRNVSDVVQHYEARVVGLPDGVTASASPEIAKLRPRQRATITITFVFASSPPARAGEYVLGMLVRSPHDPDTSRCEELVLTVKRADDVKVKVDPQLLEGGALGVFTTTVVNEGNAPVRVRLGGTDQAGRAHFVFSPVWLDVPPGESGSAQASVRCRTPWTGPPQRRELTVAGRQEPTVAGVDDVTTRLAFNQRAKLAPAALRSARGVVTLAVGVVTVLGAALLARTPAVQGISPIAQKDDPTAPAPTSEAPVESPSESPSESPTSGGTDTSPPTLTPGTPVDIALASPPGVGAAAGEHSIMPDAFRNVGISVVAGDPDVTDPECSTAKGAAVSGPGSSEGFVHPALPDDPTRCQSVPLQLVFERQVTSVQVHLAEAATGNYSMIVHYGGGTPLEQEVTQEVGSPDKPDFTITSTGAPINDVVIKPILGGTGEPPPTGVARVVVTPVGD